MKKNLLILSLILLLIPIKLFSQGIIEQKNAILEPLEAASTSLNLATNHHDAIFQFVSCIDNIPESEKIGDTLYNRLFISQTDKYGNVLNDGTKQKFYFVNTADPSQKKQFTINVRLHEHTYTNTYQHSESSNPYLKGTYAKYENNNPNIPQNGSILFNNMEHTTETSNYVFYSGEFYLNLNGEDASTAGWGDDANQEKIAHGEYEANLTVSYLSKSSSDGLPYRVYQNIFLKAYYKGNTSENATGNHVQYSFIIDPTPESFNIDLKKDTLIPVSNIQFISTIETSHGTMETSPGNTLPEIPFQVKISTSRDFNVTPPNGTFIKQDANVATATPMNSIKYTLNGSPDNSGSLVIDIPKTETIPNVQKFNLNSSNGDILTNSDGSYQFKDPIDLQVYKKNYEVKIKLDDTADRNQLQAGAYSTTLYYFVICNI